MTDEERQRRRRNLLLLNGAGLVCVTLSVILAISTGGSWLSWGLLAAAGALLVISRRVVR
jgi:hypothetical protein